MPVQGGHGRELWEVDAREPLQLVVKTSTQRRHRAAVQQGQQEASTIKEALADWAIGGRRSSSEPSRIHHQGPPLQGRRGRGTSCNRQVLLDPPNKQATGSTRFSYVWVVEFGDQVALVSVRIERLSQRIIPSSLVRLSTSELLTPCELHEVLEVKVRNKKSAHLVKVCVAKVNLRALTGGAGGTGEAAQEVQRLHDWSGGGSHRGKQPQTHR